MRDYTFFPVNQSFDPVLNCMHWGKLRRQLLNLTAELITWGMNTVTQFYAFLTLFVLNEVLLDNNAP